MPTRLESGQHQVDVAQVTGASLTTLKEWLRRYCVQGPAVLLDRSCRPHDSPRHLASAALTETSTGRPDWVGIGSGSRISFIKRRYRPPFRAVAGHVAIALSCKSHRHTTFRPLQLSSRKETTL